MKLFNFRKVNTTIDRLLHSWLLQS